MKVLQSIFFSVLMLFFITHSFGQKEVSTNENNIAIGGYDLVAYFNAHDAIRGGSEHKVTLEEVTYYFSSSANAKTFKANPKAYLPSYGGYCAFAMGMKATKVPADPTTFKIRDGKLYLFFNDYYEGKPFNTIIPWNANEVEMITKADKNWKAQK